MSGGIGIIPSEIAASRPAMLSERDFPTEWIAIGGVVEEELEFMWFMISVDTKAGAILSNIRPAVFIDLCVQIQPHKQLTQLLEQVGRVQF
jgi:hypothetical protein